MASLLHSLVVILLYCTLAFAALDFTFDLSSSNVSKSDISKYGWGYRALQMATFKDTVDPLWKGTNFYSLGVKKQKGSSDVDLIVGAFYVRSNAHPVSFVAHYDAASEWNIPVTDGTKFVLATDLTQASGFIAAQYLRVEEVAPNGTVVAYQSFKGSYFPSPDSGTNFELTNRLVSPDPLNPLKFVILSTTGSALSNYTTASFSLSAISSPTAAIINEANTPIGPSSIETIFQVNNWPYQSPSNNLVLLVGVATGSANQTGNTVASRSGSVDTQVYFSMGKRYVADNVTGNAEVSFLDGTFSINDNNTLLEAQLASKYGSSYTYRVAQVKFPPGAKYILYDPSVGVGNPMDDPQEKVSLATQTATFSFITFLIVFLTFF